MTRTLEYSGLPNPFDDLPAFRERAVRKYPHLSDPRKMEAFIDAATKNRKARYKIGRGNNVTVFFGADIHSNDLLSNPGWQFMPTSYHRAIANATLEQRENLRVIKGLEQTYFWGWQNNWLQEVTDEDYDTIMKSPHRILFKDPDIHGLHVETRAYDNIETERIPVPNLDEAERVIADRKIHNYVSGSDLGAS